MTDVKVGVENVSIDLGFVDASNGCKDSVAAIIER